jgi:hypothetical protein
VGQGKVNLSLKFRGFLQVLLISALMIAPAWGQIHKIIHGPSVLHNLGHDHHHETEHVLFSDHEEGSLLCLALDHLASGEGLQTLCTSVAIVEANPLYFSVESEPVFSERLLAFSARAPPASL